MNIRNILSDASVSALRSVVSVIAGVFIIGIITKQINAEAFGIWRTVLAYVSLITLVGGAHLHGSLIRYIRRLNEKQVFVDLLLMSVLVGAAVCVITYLVAIAIESSQLFPDIPKSLILPSSLLIGLRIPGSVLKNYPRARKNIKKFEFLSFSQTVAKSSVMVVALWYTNSLVTGLWSLVALATVINLVLIIHFRSSFSTIPSISNVRTYLNYSLPMVPQEISTNLLHNGDKFLIITLIGPASAGYYIVAYTISSTVEKFATIFNSTLYPRITSAWDENSYDDIEYFYSVFIKWYTIISIPAIIGLAAIAEPMIEVVSTPIVANRSAVLVPILSLGFAFQGLEGPLNYVLAAAERTRTISAITFSSAIINLLLNVVLIPSQGIIGAAIATLVAYAIRTSLLLFFCKKMLNIDLKKVGLVKPICAAIIMYFAITRLPVKNPYFQISAYIIIGLIIYSLMLYLFGGISKKDALYLKKLMT